MSCSDVGDIRVPSEETPTAGRRCGMCLSAFHTKQEGTTVDTINIDSIEIITSNT